MSRRSPCAPESCASHTTGLHRSAQARIVLRTPLGCRHALTPVSVTGPPMSAHPDESRSMSAFEWLLLVALSVLWGGSFFFNGVAVKELPTLTVVVSRVALAAGILLLVMRVTCQALPTGLPTWVASSPYSVQRYLMASPASTGGVLASLAYHRWALRQGRYVAPVWFSCPSCSCLSGRGCSPRQVPGPGSPCSGLRRCPRLLRMFCTFVFLLPPAPPT